MYQEFLKQMADFGHGVFTLTMLEGEADRHALKMYVYRHPSFFSVHKGTHGDIKICQLTADGMQFFAGTDSRTRSGMWDSLLDIVLFNAFMAETNSFSKYSTRPHAKLILGSKMVGLISSRWGITTDLRSVDVLLTTYRVREELLSSITNLTKGSKRERLSVEEMTSRIDSAVIPRALLHLR